MLYDLYNSRHNKSILNLSAFGSICGIANLYEWRNNCKNAFSFKYVENVKEPWRDYYHFDFLQISRHDVRTFGTALQHGIYDIITRNRHGELLAYYYTMKTSIYPDGNLTPAEFKDKIIELSEHLIKLCKDSPQFIEMFLVSINCCIHVVFVWKEHTTDHGLMRINELGWRVIQLLAKCYGWVPQATKAPDPSIWSKELTEHSRKPGENSYGDYDSRNWQEVSADDAFNMAHALREAIEVIMKGQRNRDLIESYACDQDLLSSVYDVTDGIYIADAAEFRRNTVELLEKFIEFCDGAPFLIG